MHAVRSVGQGQQLAVPAELVGAVGVDRALAHDAEEQQLGRALLVVAREVDLRLGDVGTLGRELDRRQMFDVGGLVVEDLRGDARRDLVVELVISGERFVPAARREEACTARSR